MERFHHDPSVPPNSDIAERMFLLSDNRIKVVYHLEENRITPSTREFMTPPSTGEQPFTPEMVLGYQVDPYAREPKNRHVCEQLEELMRAQEESIAQIEAAEREVGLELCFAQVFIVFSLDSEYSGCSTEGGTKHNPLHYSL